MIEITFTVPDATGLVRELLAERGPARDEGPWIGMGTFRAALAILTALAVGLFIGPWLIGRLHALQVRQSIREEGPASHQKKAGTPTMGGVLILAAIVAPVLLWGDLTEPWVWVITLTTLAFGAIGFLDDLLKVRRGKNLGLTARDKFGLQLIAGAIAALAIRAVAGHAPHAGSLSLPFLKDVILDLGWFYIPFVALVLVGSSNAVNLSSREGCRSNKRATRGRLFSPWAGELWRAPGSVPDSSSAPGSGR